MSTPIVTVPATVWLAFTAMGAAGIGYLLAALTKAAKRRSEA